jgi:cell division protein FtsL
MSWLLPLFMVLLVGLVMAAAHLLFMRWMTRQADPGVARDELPGRRRD